MRSEDCNTAFERWMYNIINLSQMDTVAFLDQNDLFKDLDSMASYAMLSEQDRRAYDADLKAYRDMRGQLEYAKMQGIEKGIEKGIEMGIEEGIEKNRADVVKELWHHGMSVDFIADVVKVSVDKVKKILGID
ncbi:MAG: Rpn family recombination-promoting nuclease/putative transposase [Muribaculaceae bacterium]|nr:Rpn family recombination-promoting nuclease/putative transposase [Muribaculaceae bacterium]